MTNTLMILINLFLCINAQIFGDAMYNDQLPSYSNGVIQCLGCNTNIKVVNNDGSEITSISMAGTQYGCFRNVQGTYYLHSTLAGVSVTNPEAINGLLDSSGRARGSVKCTTSPFDNTYQVQFLFYDGTNRYVLSAYDSFTAYRGSTPGSVSINGKDSNPIGQNKFDPGINWLGTKRFYLDECGQCSEDGCAYSGSTCQASTDCNSCTHWENSVLNPAIGVGPCTSPSPTSPTDPQSCGVMAFSALPSNCYTDNSGISGLGTPCRIATVDCTSCAINTLPVDTSPQDTFSIHTDSKKSMGLKLNTTVDLNTVTTSGFLDGDEVFSIDTQGLNYNMLATYYNSSWHPAETAILYPGVGYLFTTTNHESNRTMTYSGPEFATSPYSVSFPASTVSSFSPTFHEFNKTLASISTTLGPDDYVLYFHDNNPLTVTPNQFNTTIIESGVGYWFVTDSTSTHTIQIN